MYHKIRRGIVPGNFYLDWDVDVQVTGLGIGSGQIWNSSGVACGVETWNWVAGFLLLSYKPYIWAIRVGIPGSDAGIVLVVWPWMVDFLFFFVDPKI